MEEDTTITSKTNLNSNNEFILVTSVQIDNIPNESDNIISDSVQVNTDNENAGPRHSPAKNEDSKNLSAATDLPQESSPPTPSKEEEAEKLESPQKDEANVLENEPPNTTATPHEPDNQDGVTNINIDINLTQINNTTEILSMPVNNIDSKELVEVIEVIKANDSEDESTKEQNPLEESSSEKLVEEQNKSVDNEIVDVAPQNAEKEPSKTRNRSSRELNSLLKSARESKIINECTQVKTKMRKSKTNDSSTSLDSIKPTRRGSTASQLSSSSGRSEKTPKRSMRSQNPDFVSKQKIFLSSVTGKLARDHWESVSEAESGDDANVSATRTPVKEFINNDSITKDKTPSRDVKKSRKKLPAISSNIKLTDSSETRSDAYCWHCHWNIEPYPEESRSEKSTDKLPAQCSICPRSFHYKCLTSYDKTKVASDPVNWVCPECLMIVHVENSVNRSPTMKKVSLGKLCELLQYAWDQIIAINGTEPFMDPVDRNEFPDYDKYIVNPMCLNQIKDNITNKCYGSTEAFLSDIQWIVHNSIIFNAAQSKLTVVARAIARASRVEMAEIETCPECYAGAHSRRLTYFTDVCSNPHILLWAKLKGFPHWPGKGMSVNSQGQVDVRFFGAHDRARVPAKDCYLYSYKDPNNFRTKRQDIYDSMQEAEEHVKNLTKKYGKFVHAPMHTKFDPTKWNEQLLSMIPNYECDLSTTRILDKHSNMASPALVKPKTTRNKGYHEIETDGSDEEGSSRSTIQDDSNTESLDKSLRRKLPNREPPSPIIETKRRRRSAFQESEVTSIVHSAATRRKRASSMFVEDRKKVSPKKPKRRRKSIFQDADITIRIRKSRKTAPEALSNDSITLLSKSILNPDLSKEITEALSEIPKFIISKESPQSITPIKITSPKSKQDVSISKETPRIVTSTPKSTEQMVTVETKTTPEKKDEKPERKVKPIRLVRNVMNRKSLSIKYDPESSKNEANKVEIKNKENDKSNGKELPKITVNHGDKRKIVNESKESNKTDKEQKPNTVNKEPTSSNENKDERNNLDKESKEVKRKIKILKSNNSPDVNDGLKKTTPKRSDNFSPSDDIAISNLTKTNTNKVQDVPHSSKVSYVHTLQQKTVRTPPTAVTIPITPSKATYEKCGPQNKRGHIVSTNVAATNNNNNNVFTSAPSQTLVGRVGVRSFARMQSPPAENRNRTVEVEVKREPIELDDATRQSEKMELMNNFRLRPVNPQSVPIRVQSGPPFSKPGPSKAVESHSKAKKSFPQSKNTEQSLSGKNTMVYIPAQSAAPIRFNQMISVGRVNGPTSVTPRQITPVRIPLPVSVVSTSIVNTVSPSVVAPPLTVSMPSTSSSVRMPVITNVNGQWALAIQPLTVGDSTVMNGVVNNNENTNRIEVNTENRNTPDFPRMQRVTSLNPLDPNTPSGTLPVPSCAGPITAKINQSSVKLTDFFRNLLVESIEKLDTPASAITFYKLQIEQMRWKHQQEILELKHNHNLMLVEVRSSVEKERTRFVNEARRTYMNELENAVNNVKSKQWCAYCHQEAKMYCCWNTSYCDEECQRAHWPQHCKVCRENKNLGNQLKSLDITVDGVNKPGVLTEKPGVFTEKPGVLTEKPGVFTEKQGTFTEKPGVFAEKPGVFVEKPTLGRPSGSTKPGQFIVGLVDDSRGGSTVRCVGSYLVPVTTQSQTVANPAPSVENNLQVVTTGGGYLIVGGTTPTCSNSTMTHTID